MDLEETEGRNDCAGEGQQLFNLLTDRLEFSPAVINIIYLNPNSSERSQLGAPQFKFGSVVKNRSSSGGN
jgi:hypothetical protein